MAIMTMRDKNRGYPAPSKTAAQKSNEVSEPQGKREALRHDAVSSPEGDVVSREPLSQVETEHRILEGHRRRKRLKAGVAKRLLGNGRAVLAGVYIATAALAGAAASAVPSFSQVRPDILEIYGQQAQFTSSFSQWGWRSSEPQLNSDLCDEGSRDAMSRWIQQTAPRLVVMTECCPRVVSSSHKHAKPSQDSRRQRKEEQKVRDMCVFIQQIVDMQIGRGDQMLLELSTDCEPEAVMMCDTMIKHPSLRHVGMCSRSEQSRPTGSWITTCPFLEKELCNLRDEREREERVLVTGINRGVSWQKRSVRVLLVIFENMIQLDFAGCSGVWPRKFETTSEALTAGSRTLAGAKRTS